MSYEDFGSSAWADTSPSASPALGADDIWGMSRTTQQKDPSLLGAVSSLEIVDNQATGSENESESGETRGFKWNAMGEDQLGGLTSEPEAGPSSSRTASPEMGGVTATTPHLQEQESKEDNDNNEDDDDDFSFADPVAAPTNFTETGAGSDDDFGDFGDFDEPSAKDNGGMTFGQDDELAGDYSGFGFDARDSSKFENAPNGLQDEVWDDPSRPDPPKSLRLKRNHMPSKTDLSEQVSQLLAPMFPILSPHPPFDKSLILTNEPMRQAQGSDRMLTSETSRRLYTEWTCPPESLKPLDWKRSKVRRQLLISLGVPVNLDEVESRRAAPPLRIAGSSDAAGTGDTSSEPGSSSHPSRKGTLDSSRRPMFDSFRCEKLLSYREEQLGLVPPKYLDRMQQDLVGACTEAAELLVWLKQVEDGRIEENKRRNETIAGLIASAQKSQAATGSSSSSSGLFRKSSVRTSGSGSRTPMSANGGNKRMSSPVIR